MYIIRSAVECRYLYSSATVLLLSAPSATRETKETKNMHFEDPSRFVNLLCTYAYPKKKYKWGIFGT